MKINIIRVMFNVLFKELIKVVRKLRKNKIKFSFNFFT